MGPAHALTDIGDSRGLQGTRGLSSGDMVTSGLDCNTYPIVCTYPFIGHIEVHVYKEVDPATHRLLCVYTQTVQHSNKLWVFQDVKYGLTHCRLIFQSCYMHCCVPWPFLPPDFENTDHFLSDSNLTGY
ncbi:hypothetical protein MAR_023553 [Mya arenaria]|uniref:Uncharacterized protein n=1 Tax=Mya arenaria TaxID=6604 RepID=A0ABY7DR74_MYAAR|nr:hypothetical protein MAR_023553 [Mya arenaria]